MSDEDITKRIDQSEDERKIARRRLGDTRTLRERLRNAREGLTMALKEEAPFCVICGHQVEPWQMGGGYGHNPWPWPGEDKDRACNWCNTHIVLPVRLRRAGITAGE